MAVFAHDPYVSRSVLNAYDARPVDLFDLAAHSDIVAVAAKVSPETRGLISASVLRTMQPTAYFVNIARAAIVDYDALIDILKAGAKSPALRWTSIQSSHFRLTRRSGRSTTWFCHPTWREPAQTSCATTRARSSMIYFVSSAKNGRSTLRILRCSTPNSARSPPSD